MRLLPKWHRLSSLCLCPKRPPARKPVPLQKLCLMALVFALLCAGTAHAQYNPIPNFTGNLAGQAFRNALNNKLNGSDTISPQLVHLNFFQLPMAVTNG